MLENITFTCEGNLQTEVNSFINLNHKVSRMSLMYINAIRIGNTKVLLSWEIASIFCHKRFLKLVISIGNVDCFILSYYSLPFSEFAAVLSLSHYFMLIQQILEISRSSTSPVLHIYLISFFHLLLKQFLSHHFLEYLESHIHPCSKTS